MSPANSARPANAARMVTSGERLRRLLALVPYVAARRVVGLAETAETFSPVLSLSTSICAFLRGVGGLEPTLHPGSGGSQRID